MDENKTNLINRAKNGSRSALEQLIKLEQNNIYSTLLYLKKDENDLYDIMQNVLIKIATKINQLNNPEYFSTWLNKIIINSYYDYMRKNKKDLNIVFSSIDESERNIPDTKSNPQEKILYTELDILIKNSIRNLPIHYKIPIALREIQGLSYENISQITNTTVGTVKSRIARARGIIKNEIKKYTTE